MPTIIPADLRELLNSDAEDPVLFVNFEVDEEPELAVWAAAYVDSDAMVITYDRLMDWLGDDWTDEDIEEYLPELQETIDGIAPEPGAHFTAWLVTTRTELESNDCDVTVLPDEISGYSKGQPNWSSTGNPILHALTGISPDGDADEAQARAEQLLAAAGWDTVGEWTAVDTGSVVTVERSDLRETWTIDQVTTHTGASSTKYADKLLRLWGVTAVGREPGRGGRNLYPIAEVMYAHATRPGQGARTDLKDQA